MKKTLLLVVLVILFGFGLNAAPLFAGQWSDTIFDDGAFSNTITTTGGTDVLLKYDNISPTWFSMSDTPLSVNDGAGLAYPGADDYIYALRGNNSATFWRYSVVLNSWSSLTPTPSAILAGGALVSTRNDYLYALRGGGYRSFWRYSISLDSWTPMTDTPDTASAGAALAYPGTGDYIYAFRGNGSTAFWRYSISGDAWSAMTAAPSAVSSGGALVSTKNDYIYAFKGGSTTTF